MIIYIIEIIWINNNNSNSGTLFNLLGFIFKLIIVIFNFKKFRRIELISRENLHNSLDTAKNML